jgi:hypothetical protein
VDVVDVVDVVDAVDEVDVGLAAAVLAAETVNIIFWLK